MKIVGLDCSPTSTGCFKFELDDSLDIISKSFLGFREISKKSKESWENIITYREDQFETFYHRQMFMLPYIIEFCKDVDYVALENYSFAAKGNITMLAEFCGNIKSRLFESGKSLRLYEPTVIKLYAGKGNYKKPDMFDRFQEHKDNTDLSYLPQIPVHKKGKNAGERNKDGVSPLSDIVDAFFIASLLQMELKAKSFTLESVPENARKILTHTTKTTKVDLVSQQFISL